MWIVFLVPAMIAICVGLRFCVHLRTLSSASHQCSAETSVHEYRPLLRLPADEDFDSAARAERRRLFRDSLRRLSVNYGNLLAGIRMVMVQAGVDRPDLAKALLKNKVLFAAALCRIDLRLALHALGGGSVDASKLADALDVLRGLFRVAETATGN